MSLERKSGTPPVASRAAFHVALHARMYFKNTTRTSISLPVVPCRVVAYASARGALVNSLTLESAAQTN